MDELDLGKLEATSTVSVADPAWVIAAVIASMLVLVALILVSALGLTRARGVVATHWPSLATFPPSMKLVVAIGLVALLCVQAVAAIGVWVHTRIVHTSAAEYFFDLSVPRLIGISHAHLFGYAILYGGIGSIASLTTASERAKALIVAVLLWSGIFDVASWWGIKLVSPKFELLSAMTGVTTSVASLIVVYLVVRTIRHSGGQ